MKKYDVFHCHDERLVTSTEYIVKKGDTLYNIAKNYGVIVEDLISANNLASSLIYPNQIIVIPKTVPSGSVYFEEYIIQPNDTIEAIAEKFGVRIDLLIKYNDVSKLVLNENQMIRIPRRFNNYTVLPTDSLLDILTKTNMTLEELVMANLELWIAPGMTIKVR